MKKSFIFTAVVLSTLFFVSSVEAKVLPQSKSAAPRAVTKSSGCGSNCKVSLSKKLRADKHAVIVSFYNITSAKSINYTLIYKTNGVEQGVRGSIEPSAGNFVSRELLLGTESAGVYRYHTGITDLRLEISVEYPSKTVDKTLPIKY